MNYSKKNSWSLYLLIHCEHNKFKIGVAKKTLKRIKRIAGMKHFDLDKSYEIVCRDSKEAIEVEKKLHFIFKKYKTKSPFGYKTGFTEWFEIDCFEKVLYTVKNIMKHRGLSKSNFHLGIKPLSKEEKLLQYFNNICRAKVAADIAQLLKLFKTIDPYLIEFSYDSKSWYLAYSGLSEVKDWVNKIVKYSDFIFYNDRFNKRLQLFLCYFNENFVSSGSLVLLIFNKLEKKIELEGFEPIIELVTYFKNLNPNYPDKTNNYPDEKSSLPLLVNHLAKVIKEELKAESEQYKTELI